MLDTLYENISDKIKNLAKWIFIIEAIGAIITGFVLLIDLGFEDGWWALFIIFFGPIVAWVGSWILYAFGELAEDVHAIRYNPSINNINKNIQLIAEPYAKRETEEKAKRAAEERAKRAAEAKAMHCPKCKEDLSFMGWSESDLKEKQICPMCGVEIEFADN